MTKYCNDLCLNDEQLLSLFALSVDNSSVFSDASLSAHGGLVKVLIVSLL